MGGEFYGAGATPGSATAIVGLQPLPQVPEQASLKDFQSIRSNERPNGSIRESIRDADFDNSLPSPITAGVAPMERWNYPRVNLFRVLATFFSFTIMGANDAATGALIPYLEKYYDLTYIVISVVFLTPLVGYATAAVLNSKIHLKFGQRGIAMLGPASQLLSYIVLSCHPPYPVLVVFLIFSGFGSGLMDAAWNAWIGNMANANEIMGFLHGFYGLGGVLSPLVATTMVTKANLPWYTFYYVMAGCTAIMLAWSTWAFWNEDAKKYRDEHPRTTDKKIGRFREAISNKVTWICAFFLLIYVGIEIALGGWIVTFMIRVRAGDPFGSGMSATGFWLGITLGRVVLGFITPRIGEKLAVMIYLGLAMGLQLLFWLVPSFIVSAVAVALVGFFLGPLFPCAMIIMAKLLPKHIHVSAIGFAAAFGSGAAFVPFIVGAIAQAKGVQVLQPIILAMLVVCLGLWMLLPRTKKHSHNA